MTEPKQFMEDFARDLIAAEPMKRLIIIQGYARLLELRDAEIRKQMREALAEGDDFRGGFV